MNTQERVEEIREWVQRCQGEEVVVDPTGRYTRMFNRIVFLLAHIDALTKDIQIYADAVDEKDEYIDELTECIANLNTKYGVQDD